jgi:hypothetical protein
MEIEHSTDDHLNKEYLKYLTKNWENLIRLGKMHQEQPHISIQDSIRLPFFNLLLNYETFTSLWDEINQIFLNVNNSFLIILLNNEKKIQQMMVAEAATSGEYIRSINLESKFMTGDFSSKETWSKECERLKKAINHKFMIEVGNIFILNTQIFNSLLQWGQKNRTNPDKFPLIVLLGQFIDILLKGKLESCFFYYPESSSFQFFANFQSIHREFSWEKASQQLFNLFPHRCSYDCVLRGQNSNIGIQIKRTPKKIQYFFTNFPKLGELEFSQSPKFAKRNFIKNFFIPQSVLSLDIPALMPILTDLFYSPIPCPLDRKQYLFQRILEFYTRFDRYWGIHPSSSVYNEKFRYMLYRCKLFYNPRKIAYWAIPQLLKNLYHILPYEGNVLLLIADKDYSLHSLSAANVNQIIAARLVQIKNNMFIHSTDISGDLQKISEEMHVIKTDTQTIVHPMEKTLAQLKLLVEEKHIIISSIVFIRRNLLQSIINDIGIGYHARRMRSILYIFKFLKVFQNPNNFTVYPSKNALAALQNTHRWKIIKKMGSLFTDQVEF